LTLSVGNLQGPPFQGVVTVAFSQEGVPGQVTRTLRRDAVGWSTEFVPPEAGPWDVDVRFLTTRPKALHARFTVSEPPVPLIVWRVLLAIAGVLLIVRVMRAVTQRGVTPEPPPGGASEPVAEPVAGPASEPRPEPVAAPPAAAQVAAPEAPAEPVATPPSDPPADR
ncbi:hypothetical protein D7V97_43435, partial [Corallococcus sp. CA053C]|uniref:hypothetical protein n=1 Tax=Corallococcus sp. CA053C TaxID=2316732 RepID=UPI000EA075C9